MYYQDQCLVTKPAPPETPVLRARSTKRVMPQMIKFDGLTVPAPKAEEISKPKAVHHYKPGPNHPWRRPLRVHIDRG